MITLALLGLPEATSLGSDELIVSIKISLSSNILSSFTEILNGTLISPAGSMTEYGPEV